MNQFPQELEQRTLLFAQSAISLCRSIPETTITRPIINQLVRSSTSIGANYAEANNASSPIDFRNKIFIAKKEANETKYWLKVVDQFAQDHTRINSLLQESQELILIFQSIINKLKSKT